MQLSKASAKVLGAFLAEPTQDQYGFGIMRATGVKSGSLYPILQRFERLGWIEGHDEEIDEQAEGRPKRRLYRLTPAGERKARKAVTDFYHDLPVPVWLPGFEGA
ncbi:MAG: PadR family transcriptional regulator [Actinomycetota bacterium]